ncbi:MAG: DUF5012 domain-containing protein [Salinivirgaceae bacterium]|nr:DUF5012 domain-containing protein [Salinivirgaceae bacterium]
MKNRFLLLMALAASVVSLSSCEKETEGKTRITYYPTIELQGDETVYVNKGDAYVEPGYVSFLNGEDVTSQVTVLSNVDESTSGVYTINYVTIQNEDGFDNAASRKVVVLDFDDAIEGIYVLSDDSFRDYDGTVTPYGAAFEILLIGNGDGTYNVSDLFAGWYDQRAGYGSNYACQAVMEISGSSVSVDPGDTFVPGWGDSIDDFHDASYSAGTLKYQVDYAGMMTFNVTLVKQPIE